MNETFRWPTAYALRVGWVTDRAQSVWAPRLTRIAAAWHEIQWLSVAAGVRPAATFTLASPVYVASARTWMNHRLSSVVLDVAAPAGGRRRPTVAVAAVPRLQSMADAWLAGDEASIGGLLGYPACCCDAFGLRRPSGAEDDVWSVAASSVERADGATSEVRMAPPPVANLLWARLNVRAIPHIPCRFTCLATSALGEALLDVGRAAGYAAEVGWLREILSWPVEWSALHGIAEIKTPVLKLSTSARAAQGKQVVRFTGTSYPAEGASGVRFPFQQPARTFVQGIPLSIRRVSAAST